MHPGHTVANLGPVAGCTVTWGKDPRHLELFGWPESCCDSPSVFGLSIYIHYVPAILCMLFESSYAAYCSYSIKGKDTWWPRCIFYFEKSLFSLKWIEGAGIIKMYPQKMLREGFLK